MSKELKAEYWLKCWVAMAAADTVKNASTATGFANKMVDDFDKKFPGNESWPDQKRAEENKDDRNKS